MGVSYGNVVLLGVKLKTLSALFEEDVQVVDGCQHSVSGTKYCPECGALAQREVTRQLPKIKMDDDWRYSDAPCLADMYYVYHNPEVLNDTYIGVYKKLNYIPGDPEFLTTSGVQENMEKVEGLLTFLKDNGIEYDEGTEGIHVLPYIG